VYKEAIAKQTGPEILKTIARLISVSKSNTKVEITTLGTNKIKNSQYGIAPLENPLKYIPIKRKTITPYLEIS
jgi:hypothetical protein